MNRLQQELGLAYLLITHNLPIVRHVSDRLAVMYLGRLVETGTDRSSLRPARAIPIRTGFWRRSRILIRSAAA
jgi:ABC-type glutathione transport system ATPase component